VCAAAACDAEHASAPAALSFSGTSGSAAGEAGSQLATTNSLTGTVLETMSSGGYTYVRLATSRGEEWGAVPETPVKTGELFTIVGAMGVTAFSSQPLNRTFDRIYFGVAGGDSYRQIAGMHNGALPQRLTLEAPLEKAAGPEGRTVAEIVRNRSALDGKPVAVRGKVVRYSPGILERNWLHLQDGTGDEREFDLPVTTTTTAAVGETVLARGVVRVDRDFGAGTSYPVVIEEASVSR
jgi:hypothetical protein